MQQKVLITAALPYANGALHFGHIAGAYLPADIYSRFNRLCGEDVLFICGSDEYGVAITLSAELANRAPKEHVDHFHEINKAFFSQLNISFDHYSRTTWPGHIPTAQSFFLELLENGYIEERTTEQLYCEQDDKFLADRYVCGTCPRCGFDNARGDECQKCGASYEATELINPRSKLSNAPLSKRPTNHWFLLLDRLQKPLDSWLATKNHWKSNVLKFAENYSKEMHPRAITRDCSWGVPLPLPNTKGKVLYVWFEAPIGYISATKEWAALQGTPEKWRDYWCDEETKLVQFIGKDNIPFHAVIFPAMELGQNQPYKIVDELPANEFLNLEGRRFSKSDNWTIELDEFLTHYSVDQLRYTLAANAPENADSEFVWKDFQSRCNAELLGKLGNFANRVLLFALKQCGGIVPQENYDKESSLFLEKISTLVAEIKDCYTHFKVRNVCQLIMQIAQECNTFFDQRKPWQQAKDPALHGAMRSSIRACLEAIKLLSLVTCPIIPQTAQSLWQFLGYTTLINEDGHWTSIVDQPLPMGQTLSTPHLLFRRIEDDEIATEIAKLK